MARIPLLPGTNFLDGVSRKGMNTWLTSYGDACLSNQDLTRATDEGHIFVDGSSMLPLRKEVLFEPAVSSLCQIHRIRLAFRSAIRQVARQKIGVATSVPTPYLFLPSTQPANWTLFAFLGGLTLYLGRRSAPAINFPLGS